MSTIGFFRGGFVTFVLMALITSLNSGPVSAEKVLCDYHFSPTRDHTPGKASCIAKSNLKRDYACVPNSCSTTNGLTFVNCLNTRGIPRQLVLVKQYFRQDRHIAAQDRDQTYWECPYEGGNDVMISCDACS
ncbi:hypothetical protein KEM48_009829 [Puccinia striiformis f. sp. tritici PST-130]|nr:hypothetical protein KEM48_009829 [Puccinia striiformis f. sp. tritici PST-130]